MSRYDSSPVYFGVDIGTQGIRGTAWQNGQVLTRAQRQLITHTPQNGWAVQQLDEIWENFVLVVRDMADICYQKRYIVRGIGLDATASMVMVDSSGHSLTDVLLWMDIRGHKYTSLISTLTGMSESAELPWSKALWLLEHSDSGLPADRLLVEVADWIVWRLTGIWSRSESSAILKWHGKRPTFLADWIDHFPNIVANAGGGYRGEGRFDSP